MVAPTWSLKGKAIGMLVVVVLCMLAPCTGAPRTLLQAKSPSHAPAPAAVARAVTPPAVAPAPRPSHIDVSIPPSPLVALPAPPTSPGAQQGALITNSPHPATGNQSPVAALANMSPALGTLAVLGNAANSSNVAQTTISTAMNTTAQTHTYNFIIETATASPDGTSRSIITVNGQFPAPPITSNVGDTLIIHVTNKLTVPTTLHWHGILQTGTNNMDGVPGIVQSPIAPGGTFTYQFITDAPGTYWYHSHSQTQYIDGLKGSLIVGGDPSDIVLQISDWYHTGADALAASYLTPASMGNEPIPDNALVNGIGQAAGCTGASCTYARVVTSADRVPLCSASTASQQRIRIINTSGFAVFDFSIDNHNLGIVAADGMPIVTQPASSIRMNAGQRYDVLICRASGRPAPAFIRALFDQPAFTSPSASAGALAILAYSATDTSIPTTVPTASSPLFPRADPSKPTTTVPDPANVDPYDLQPSPAVSLPHPNQIITIDISFANDATGVNRANINGHTFSLPTMDDPTAAPLAQLALAGQTSPANSMPNIFTIQSGQVYQVILNNYDNNEHPIHFHGHVSYVLARGDVNEGVPYSVTKPNGPLNYNNPIGRDTMSINGNSSMVIQFTANNPGAWIMHCHIDWHIEAGFALVFMEGFPTQPAVPPPSGSCPTSCPASGTPGNLTICPSGDQHQVQVYCNGKGAAYLNVKSGNTTNYSLYGKSPNSNGGAPVTAFTKLRFNPATLTVSTDDFTFANSTGRYCFGSTCYTTVPLGNAADCLVDNVPAPGTGHANIDLTGTGLAIAPGQFVVSGFNADGSAKYSSNNQVVDAVGGGYCGGISPRTNQLQLQYASVAVA
ncbi:hypothetical protein WJX72_004296 [[Myrmecia] bisecta]|uniref:Laccase n=1 Tax=[Myrmecia] bisecta TaxID=41462 RepID=A0AAW1QRB7_9CHLO